MILTAPVVFIGCSVWTVVHSFTSSRLLPRLDFVGLAQDARLWNRSRWLVSVENLAIYGIAAQVLTLVIGFLLAGLRGIDDDIWKAARVDGLPAWKTWLRVVIPMMRPVFATCIVLISAGIIKLYDLVVALTNGGPDIASEVPVKYVQDCMFANQNPGQGFAASTMMLATVLAIIVPFALLRLGRERHA